MEWVTQKRDPDCVRIMKNLKHTARNQAQSSEGDRLANAGGRSRGVAPADSESYRVAEDGLLERKVQSTNLRQPAWVPVVPEGYATGHLTWKKFVFLQCHPGVLGGHRSADKTYACMKRLCWWRHCLLYTSPSPRDGLLSRMPSSA